MLTVLLDDVRSFRDGRECLLARSSSACIALLESLRGKAIDELWLDHDLVGEDTAMPVVDLLVAGGFEIALVVIHTNNSRAGVEMDRRLKGAGYRTRWSYDIQMWVHGSVRPEGHAGQ